MRLQLGSALSLLLVGCADPFSAEPEIARNELLALAPIGTDARLAVPKLVDRGFVCNWKESRQFAGLSGSHDFLYCDQTSGVVMRTRWQLALVHQNYIVKEARFGISYAGL
jgi:hypothetical protein